ncbi:hydantoinase/carbamoylase family amidase [Salinicola sp. 4072]|jgi:N-carbamoyl-L-amino-acid hydrolase|uniref:hydantoinase/carbamoylase family amidase n=1 Tax=Salinicola TaxID=404432 RepID=UPI0026F2B3DE|nr:hydantoinase/carbamoylase family amidase [Salinicola salarius]
MTVTVDGQRLWERVETMAKLGGTLKGGVCRLALDDNDITAHRLLADLAKLRGFRLLLDDAGNLFLRREGSDASLAPLVSGSHSDSQPTGGRFDGIFGVLAAFEALEAIDAAGVETRHPLECVIWNNEEGSRFTPGCMGSGVYAGVKSLETAHAALDSNGVSMADAIARLHEQFPDAEHRDLGTPFAALLEAHIEQGPLLEAGGEVLGVVTGMQGMRRFRVEVTGKEDHSGTTPRSLRQDALVDAVAIINELHALFWDEKDEIRFTIGHFALSPNAWSVVPGQVTFGVDFRYSDAGVLKSLGDRIAPLAAEAARHCQVQVTQTVSEAPVHFEGAAFEAIRASAAASGQPWREIYSGAGHDCRYFPPRCPTGMVFIPCEKGISHNEAENAEPEHVTAGAQVIADSFLRLDASLP